MNSCWGLRLALPACRTGDTFGGDQVGPAGPVPARCPGHVDELNRRNVKLTLGGSIQDPAEPVGPLLFNVLATVAEFSVISTRRDGHLPEVRAAAVAIIQAGFLTYQHTAEPVDHIRDEHSTFTWLLEPMITNAGYRIEGATYADDGILTRYLARAI